MLREIKHGYNTIFYEQPFQNLQKGKRWMLYELMQKWVGVVEVREKLQRYAKSPNKDSS